MRRPFPLPLPRLAPDAASEVARFPHRRSRAWRVTWLGVGAGEAGPSIPGGVTYQESRKIACSMVEFSTKQWLSHHQGESVGLFKRSVYFIIRPLLSFKYSRYLSPETLQAYRPRFCLGARGLPLESRRAWGSKYLKNIREALCWCKAPGPAGTSSAGRNLGRARSSLRICFPLKIRGRILPGTVMITIGSRCSSACRPLRMSLFWQVTAWI